MGTFKQEINSADSKQFGDHKMTMIMLKRRHTIRKWITQTRKYKC